MKLLLDTHAFLWAAMEPRLLSAKIRRRLEDPSTGIVVSVVSALEIATKFRLGKLPGAAAIVADYAAAVRGMQAQPLAIQDNHALRGRQPATATPRPVRPTACRTSEIEELTLVSKDRALLKLGIELLW